jgi:hypothetical protein
MSRRVVHALVPVALAVAVVVSAGAGPRTADVSGYRLHGYSDGAAPTLTRSRLARASADWNGGPTLAETGETLSVYVSTALAPGLGTPQSWADFIAALEHGPEISSLTAFIATYEETREICGEHALGCYAGNRMVATGESVDEVDAVDVVRHEYGHHIALHRANPPWAAIDWGPKHWATALDVCRRADRGAAAPGDEGDDYAFNPGEAWAETYRVLAQRRAGDDGAPWIVDESFLPDEAALAAAERDVVQPWTSPRKLVLRHTFTRKSPRSWTIPLSTPLDGSVEIMLTVPRNGLQDVTLVDGEQGTVLARGLWASRRTRGMSITICGRRSLLLRVTQKGAFGRVVLTVSAA